MIINKESVQKMIYAGFKLVDFAEVERGILYSATDTCGEVYYGALMYKYKTWVRASNHTYGSQAEAMLDLIAAHCGTLNFVESAAKLLLRK